MLTPRKRQPDPPVLPKGSPADWLGLWSATVATVIGVVYVVALAVLAVTGQLAMPPSQPIQVFGAVVAILAAPLLVVVLACVHQGASEARRAYSLSALAFTVLFAAMVSINRYVQLTVVRQGLMRGAMEQLEPFLPYGSNSVMFSLEILGWGFFLSLAALCAAPVFTAGGIERWLRGLFITYGLLGLTSALGLVFASPIAVVGFVAWGPVLDAITALLAVWFWRRIKTAG